MKLIDFRFRLTVLFRLISLSAATRNFVHSQMMASIRSGDLENVENLLDANPNCLQKFKPAYWSMALHQLNRNPSSHNRKIILEYLIERLENKNEIKKKWNPLICAIIYGDTRTLNKVIKVVDINGRNSLGQTALIVAVGSGFFEKTEQLLNCGADVNLVDEKKYSALHYACNLSDKLLRERFIHLLLSNHADVSLLQIPYRIHIKNCDFSKVLSSDPTVRDLNSDELLLRRLKLSFEEIGKTFATALLMVAFATLSNRLTTSV